MDNNISWLIIVDEYEYKSLEERMLVTLKGDTKPHFFKTLAEAIEFLRTHTDLKYCDCVENYYMKSRTHSYSGAVAI